MAQHSAEPVKTFSIGFEGIERRAHLRRAPYARQMAKLIRRATITRSSLRRTSAALLPQLIWHLDEPVADSALLTTYLVAEFARRDVKVILSGVGGDELFGGYPRYLGEHYGRLYNRIPRLVAQARDRAA